MKTTRRLVSIGSLPRSGRFGPVGAVVVLAALAALPPPAFTQPAPAAAQPTPAFAQPAPAAAQTAEEPNGGRLLCVLRGERVPMPLLDMDVSIRVSGIMSVARLTQRFENPADTTVEAVYVFPLPEHAAVRHMEMRIGDRRVVSRIKEREEAKRTYETAKAEGKKTALIEQERPNLFTTSIANVNPGKVVDVVLEYVEEVAYEDGVFGITFPLTFTPRYVPATQWRVEESTGLPSLISSIVPDARRLVTPFREAFEPGAPTASFRVTIAGGVPLAEVRCLSHAAAVSRKDDAWTVAPRAERVLADRDLRVTWRPASGDAPEAALLTETTDGDTYGLFMLAPPDPALTQGAGLSTRTLFILDVSGSMAGPSIEQARRALSAALDRLRPADQFNILAFNQGQRLYLNEWVEATPRDVAHAQGWIQALEADGGTEIHPALLRGLSLFGPERPGEVSRVIFLTDGAVGNEAQVLEEIVSGLGAIRVHAIGIGHSPNRYFIRKLAETGRGLSTFIFDPETVGSSMAGFLSRVERPVLTDLELSWPGGTVAESYPPLLPDLHAGEPLLVSLRWEGEAPERVTLRGRGPAGVYETSVAARRVGSRGPNAARPGGSGETNVTAGAEGRLDDGGAIPTRWARAKVEELTDARLRGGDQDSLRAEIVRTGLTHHLVTSFTSLVAVEERITADGEAVLVPVANALPHGSQLLGTLPAGGTLSPLRTLLAVVLWITGFAALRLSRKRQPHEAA